MNQDLEVHEGHSLRQPSLKREVGHLITESEEEPEEEPEGKPGEGDS